MLAFEKTGIAMVAADRKIFDVPNGEFLVEGRQDFVAAFRKALVAVANVNDDGVPDVPGVEDFEKCVVVTVVVAEKERGGHAKWILLSG